MSRIGLLALGLLVLYGSPARAQAPDRPDPPRLSVVRISDSDIDLDGRITEDAWLTASAGNGFTQRDPTDGAAGSEDTEVRVLYSATAIYVAVRAFDRDPAGIHALLTPRDNIAISDRVGVLLDSYDDRRTAFRFAVTPAGSLADAIHVNDCDCYDISWNAVWAAEAAVDEEGWSAEFRIPFTQLRYDPDRTTWGIQVFRTVQRNAETAYWAPYSRNTNGFVSQFGRLDGLQGLPSPKRLEVTPTTVANARFQPRGTGEIYQPGRDGSLDAGLDVKWGLTPNFTLDFTANPDFGQVEADPAVVNLSAFETFLPERRPFFVEGSAQMPWGTAFNSRRIGRAPQGSARAPEGGTVERADAATILGAAKLTGKAGGLGLGIMSALTGTADAVLRDATGDVVGRAPIEPLTHYFAGRASQDFAAGAHTLSVYATAVNRRLGHDFPTLRSAAYSSGVRGEHRFRRNEYGFSWWVEGSLIQGSTDAIRAAQLSSIRYFQRPDATHVEVDPTRTALSGLKTGIDMGKNAGAFRYYLGWERVTPGFEQNDLGFHGRVDSNGFWGGAQYVRNRAIGPFRTFHIGPDASHNRTTGGEVESYWFRPVLFSATFLNNWTIGINPVAYEWDRWSPTALRGGPGLRNDVWHNSFLNLGSDSRRRVGISLNANRGGVLGQSNRFGSVGTTIHFRPSNVLTGNVGISYNERHDPQEWVGRRLVGDSTHYILGRIQQRTLNVTTRVNWTMSPTLSFQLYAQPFVSSGRYGAFREVVAPNARGFEERLRLYGERLTCGEAQCAVDVDSDGTTDFSFQNPDFTSQQLRATAILRWEYRPGSVVYVGWQHGRTASLPDGAFRGFADLGDLLSRPSNNTLLVKASYWFSY